jgi:hypothetical protein
VTLLAQVEACLNSRPLCRIENARDALTVLAPRHFLIGQSLLAIPELENPEQNISFNKRWKYVKILAQQFWKK